MGQVGQDRFCEARVSLTYMKGHLTGDDERENAAVQSLLKAIEASDMREAAYSDDTQIMNVAAWSTGQYYVAFADFGRGHGTRTYTGLDDMLAGESVVRDLADRQVWTPVMCEELYAWD